MVQGFFWVLIFAPIQSSLSLETQSTSPRGGGGGGLELPINKKGLFF